MKVAFVLPPTPSVGARAVMSAPDAASGAPAAEAAEAAPRGLPVSGRSWARVQTKRTSAMSRPAAAAAPKSVRSGAFNASMGAKAAVQSARAASARVAAERAAAVAELRAKREEKQRRRAENVLKGATYQVIKDPKKLAKMNKRQLKQVKRTVVDAKGNTKLVGAYER
jgi:rRNA-processing protein CGR1